MTAPLAEHLRSHPPAPPEPRLLPAVPNESLVPRAEPSRGPSAFKAGRLVSLDAYRGFIMLVMASGGLAIPAVASHFPNSRLWQTLAFNTDHVPWVGCSFWDLIQPSFMFMVGVAMPYSFASRKARGDSATKRGLHVVWRSLLLVLLGIFLSSNGSPRTNFTFVNVLTQIGLGYGLVYLLLGRGVRIQAAAFAGILVAYWLLFLVWPLPGPDFDYRAVGWDHWQGLSGWFAHWDKNTNAAAAFDTWFLNLFPPVKPNAPFRFNPGGYQTLNFVPSMATMLLGLMAGEMLRSPRTSAEKLLILVLAAAGCLALGWLSGELVCPIVKRIWTPSWVLYSAGWTFALLASFYAALDLKRGPTWWAFPLVVVGMNSIAMYCMAQLIKGWVSRTLTTHFAPVTGPVEVVLHDRFGLEAFSGVYNPIAQSAAVLAVLWLICLWMYRRGIFLRI
jgi:heparan-alpha-glucosaminide N-acetyltransferase